MENNKEQYTWMAGQISQLSVLPGFSQIKPEGLDALVKFMLRICPDQENAERVIMTALAEEEKMPPPVFLREILERKTRSADKPPLPGMPGYIAPPIEGREDAKEEENKADV